MNKSRKIALWVLTLVILLVSFVFWVMPLINITSDSEADADIDIEMDVPDKQGLTIENENTYYYNEDGTLFTGGIKEVAVGDTTDYYFFQEDGKAFIDGLKEISSGNTTTYYFFQSDGKAQTSNWETVNGTSYYFQANGQAAKDTFLTIGSNLYYFDDTCVVTTGGWFCVGDGYYFADENGVLSTDTVIEGYKLDSAGKSTTKYRIIQCVTEHTNPSMSEQEKIDALYDWVLNNDMSYIRSYEHVKADWVWQDSWVDDMSASQMDQWGGNCYRYAAFLGMLIHEATGLPVTVYHGQTPGVSVDMTFHGWSAVYQDDNWYIYDVELQKFTEYTSDNCYKVLALESPLHVQGVGTKLYSE